MSLVAIIALDSLLADISDSLDRGTIDLATAARRLVQFVREYMRLDEVGLWVFDGEGDKRTLKQIAGCPDPGAGASTVMRCLELHAEHPPLWAAIRVNATTIAMLGGTRRDDFRAWSPREAASLQKIATRVAGSYGRLSRRRRTSTTHRTDNGP